MSKNKVQIEIDVDTLQAVRQISKMQHQLAEAVGEATNLKKEAQKATKELSKLTDAGLAKDDPKVIEAREKVEEMRNAYNEARDTVKKYNVTIEEHVKKIGLAGLSNKELNNYLRQQNSLYNNAKRGSDEYASALEKLGKAEAELAQRRKDKKNAVLALSEVEAPSGFNLENVAEGAAMAAGFAVVTSASELLSSAISKVSEKIVEVIAKSDKISDIKNAIKSTTIEAEKLNSQITQLDTRLDQNTRREILIEAGKLDVPTNELIAYTQAMAEATITMQEDFPQGAGMMTQQFTKIKSLFKDTRDLDYPSSIRQIGSALKGLADQGTATANWQSEFLLRLGALDEKVRPTITELMGLGAALEESGLTDEIAASGVQSVLGTAYKNTELFAKFFGQSKKDFEAFINLNPNQFLFEFAEKLKPLTASQEMQTLKNLKIESQEASKVLGVLANKTGIVADKQAQANQYFLAGTRLTELYNEKNDNLAGKVERAWNKIGAVFLNSKLSTFLGGLINTLADGTLQFLDTSTKLDKLKQSFQSQQQAVTSLEKGVTPLLDKYDKLNINAASATKNQGEIQKIISSLSTILPASTIQWDKYGKAIGISTDKARDFIKVQQAMLKAQNASLINELNNKLKSDEDNLARLQRLNKGEWTKSKGGIEWFRQTNVTFGDAFGEKAGAKGFGFETKSLINPAQWKALQDEISNTKKLVDETKLAIKGLSGEVEIPQPTKPETATGTDTFGGNDDAIRKAQHQADQRKINHQKLLDDLAQMEVKAIADDYERKVASLSVEFNIEDNKQKELVKKKELDQTDYQNWYKKAYQGMLDEVKREEVESNKKIAEDLKEKNTKALLRRLELHKDELQAELEEAKATEDLKAIYTAELNLSVAEEEIELAKATAEEKAQIEKNFAKVRKAIHDKFTKDRETKDQKERANEYDNKMSLIKAEEEARKKLFDKIAQWQQSINQVVSAFFDFQAQGYQNQQTREDNLYNKKLQNLETKKTKGIISEGEYNKKKTAFEKEHDAKSRTIKQKAAEADKVARISQAVMTTAQAVINAFAVGKDPFSIATLAATAGIVGALQVAKIAGTEIPQYFDGGWTHQSSNKGVDGKGGRVSITHPNEFYVNARGTSAPAFAAVLPILESLNAGNSISTQTVVNNSNVSSTNQAIQDNSALVQTLGKMVDVTSKLSDKLDNLEAKMVWDYSTHKDYNRSKNNYDKSNQESYLQ